MMPFKHRLKEYVHEMFAATMLLYLVSLVWSFIIALINEGFEDRLAIPLFVILLIIWALFAFLLAGACIAPIFEDERDLDLPEPRFWLTLSAVNTLLAAVFIYGIITLW